MGLVIVPDRLREPPLGQAVINRRDPLGSCLDEVFLGTSLLCRSLDRSLSGTLPSGAVVKATARGLAVASSAANTASAITIAGATPFPYVLVFYGWTNASFGQGTYLSNSVGGNLARISSYSATTWQLEVRHSLGTQQFVYATTGAGSRTGLPICAIAVVYSGTDYRIFANGNKALGTVNCGTPAVFNTTYPPLHNNNGGAWLQGFGFGRAISDVDALRITANPSSIWGALSVADSPIIWAPSSAGGSGALAGDAQAIASATGALSVAVPVTGAAIGVVTASGTLSTAMPLSGVAAAVASASGTLTLGIAISGAALANASASGQMKISVAISGAAIMQAAATGALSVSGGSALAGAAVAQASASGALSVAVPLAGAAQAHASATGNLTTGSSAALAGAAVAVASASGVLTVTAILSGSAVAQVAAAGWMVIQIPLSGAAIAHAAATGALGDGGAPLVLASRRSAKHGAITGRPESLSTGRRPWH